MACICQCAGKDSIYDAESLSEILDRKKFAAKKFAQKDIDGLLTVFAEDVTFMPPGMEAVHGREALRTQYQEMFDNGAAAIEWDVKEVELMNRGTLYDRGLVQVLNASGDTIINGKYVVVWKKIGGKWLDYIDIFNSNT